MQRGLCYVVAEHLAELCHDPFWNTNQEFNTGYSLKNGRGISKCGDMILIFVIFSQVLQNKQTNQEKLRLEQASLLERWKYSITEAHSAFSKQSTLVESPLLGV